MPQTLATMAGGWHDSKGGTCEAERLTRDHRVPIQAKLVALGIGAACIGALEPLQLPIEAVLANGLAQTFAP
jgi:hypothetical protein